jgi:hypothetical protein
MESPSGYGRAGIRIQDCFLRGRASHLASASESVSLAGLAGDGTTGDLTGIITMSSSITMGSYPTAESLLITTTLITVVDFMAKADFTAAAQVFMAKRGHSMDSRPVLIPAHSAALITEESRGAFPPEGNPASVEVSTEAEASMVAEVVTAEVVTGNSVPITKDKLRHGEAKL